MLEVQGLSVAYGQHVALKGASVRVDKGQIVVILGANGAGKSTLLKAVSGVCEGRVDGSVRIDGTEIAHQPPHRIVEEGVALVPEGRGIFADLTVRDNLVLGAYSKRAREEEADKLERVHALFPKLRERSRQIVRTMSGGEQQMVAIGRAMMSNPQILTLDEPSLGLSPLLCRDLFQSLRTVRQAGLGILLVEQNAKQSLAIADRGYLLENGRIVHEDRAEALMRDPAVQNAYLGGGAVAPPRPVRAGPQAPAQAPAEARPEAQARGRSGGPSPSEIAAAALQRLERPAPAVPADRSGPLAPAATQARDPAVSRPSAQAAPSAPSAQAAQRPASAHAPAPAPAAGGIDIGSPVARARESAEAARGTGRQGGPQSRAPAFASPSRPAATGMPDLGSSADRLKSVLAEIEEAATRARAYRPSNRKP